MIDIHTLYFVVRVSLHRFIVVLGFVLLVFSLEACFVRVPIDQSAVDLLGKEDAYSYLRVRHASCKLFPEGIQTNQWENIILYKDWEVKAEQGGERYYYIRLTPVDSAIEKEKCTIFINRKEKRKNKKGKLRTFATPGSGRVELRRTMEALIALGVHYE